MDCDGYVTAQHTTQIAALHDICAHYLPELFTDSPAWKEIRSFLSQPFELPAAPELDALLSAAYGYPIVLCPRTLVHQRRAPGVLHRRGGRLLVAHHRGSAGRCQYPSPTPRDHPPMRELDTPLEGLSTDPADRVPGSWCIADGVADANFVFLHRADDSGITVVDIRPHVAGHAATLRRGF